MGKITFTLAAKSKSGYDPILLYYSCSNGRLKYYTRERTDKEKWPDRLNRGTRAQLDRIRGIVENFIIDCKVKNIPVTKEQLKQAIDKVIKIPFGGLKGDNYFDQMSALVDDMESGKLLTPSSKRYSPGSIKTFRFTIQFLKRFDPNLTPGAVTIDTYKSFIGYCQQLNYSTNYIGTQIKNWKSLGRAIGGTDVYDTKAFRKIKEDTIDIFLDEKELELIYRHPVATEKKMHARDIFIVGCFTGLRISDLKQLTKKNIDSKFIYIANEKTDINVVIPMHPFVKEIVSKYKGFPPYVHEAEINRIIKKVAQEAGINDMSLS